ncbi:AAA family ATPase [Catenulispora yoronensis]
MRADAGLHGRARELEVLDRLLLELRDGRSRALVLRGESGVGKTTLLAHLAERAGRAGRVVRTAEWRPGRRSPTRICTSCAHR